MRRASLLLAPLMLASLNALAATVRSPVAYELDGAKYEGVLVYDDAVKTPRPGLLLVPNWLGINEANLAQAALVAGSRYVVFVADVYGVASRPRDRAEAGKAAGALKANRAELRRRTAKALEVFRRQTVAFAAGQLGAIGFCFGGTAVVELAKDGADVAGVVSFHGGLDAPQPTASKPKASVLALHGAADPTVSPEQLKAFQEDLHRVGADWSLVSYGGAVHSFTDVDANNPGVSQYDAKVAGRAYRAMHDFFDELFTRR